MTSRCSRPAGRIGRWPTVIALLAPSLCKVDKLHHQVYTHTVYAAAANLFIWYSGPESNYAQYKLANFDSICMP